MIVTITRAHRDALYEEMLSDPTGVGDSYLALNNRDGEAERRLWQRFEAELRLLDQLGWSPVEPLDRFEIDMPPEVLVRAGRPAGTRRARGRPALRRATGEPGHRPAPTASAQSVPRRAPPARRCPGE